MKKIMLLSILLMIEIGAAREYIAIIEFEGIGVSQQEARSLTQRLTSEMIKLEIYQVLERAEMKKLLSEQKFQSSGCVSTQCAVDIGKMLGAKYMIVGSVNKVGRTFSIDARMIDVETGESYVSANYDYTGEIDLLLKQGMTNIAYQLCEIDMAYLKSTKTNNSKEGGDNYYAIGTSFNYGFGLNGYDWNYDAILSLLIKRYKFGIEIGIGGGQNQLSAEDDEWGDRISWESDISTVYKIGLYFYIYEKHNVALFTGINYLNKQFILSDNSDWSLIGEWDLPSINYSVGINILDWFTLEGGMMSSLANEIAFERNQFNEGNSIFSDIEFSNIDFKATIFVPFGYN